MTRRNRGSTAAMTPEGVRGQLRRQFLQFYDHDHEFAVALRRLGRSAAGLQLRYAWQLTPPLIWAEEPSGTAVRAEFSSYADRASLSGADQERAWQKAFAPTAAYLDGLALVANRFGLDRLGGEGINVIHEWCFYHQEATTYGGRWPARLFSQGYHAFGPVVEVGEVSTYDLGVIQHGGTQMRVIDQEVRPVIRVAGRAAHWDPTGEPRGTAFKRLRKRFGRAHENAIRAELDRMTGLAADARARALDTRSNVDRDLQWLYWHLRHREGPAEVARRAGLPSTERAVAMVRQAVWRMARETSIALLPGWSDWPRGEDDDVVVKGDRVP